MLDNLGIKHIRTQPYFSLQNGKVERSLRIDNTRFYLKSEFTSYQDIKKKSKRYVNRYNNIHTKTLGFKSPGAGIGVSFPMGLLSNYNQYHLERGSMSAYIRKYDSKGKANVVAQYVHAKVGLSGPSFTFSKTGPSIGVSITATSDSMINYNNWVY